MKKTILIAVILSLASLQVQAQKNFPKNEEEDSTHVMSAAYWNLWNTEEQKKIDRDIDENRKADGNIILPQVKEGTKVKVELVKHDFIFGAHIFNFNQLGSKERNDKYKALYGTLFNSATIAFYWRAFETEPNRLRFREEYWDTEDFWNNEKNPKQALNWRRPATDPVVKFCEQKGIRLHGHTMIWGNRKWQNPDWLMNFMPKDERIKADSMLIEKGNTINHHDYDTWNEFYQKSSPAELQKIFPIYTRELNRLFAKRISDIAKYYAGRLDSWDIVNESNADYTKNLLIPGDSLCKSTYGLMAGDYAFNAFQTAVKVFPQKVKLNINDYTNNQSYADEVKDLLKRGCKIDIVGSQMHLFNPQQCLDIAKGEKIETPEIVRNRMKIIGSTGLPIHLSEITIPAPGNDTRGRQIQAVIARNLYRLWFSIKPMMGITWWNVVDDCGAPGETSVSGLFTRDMQPKPAYYALEQLINHEWKTSFTTTVSRGGKINFRGFRGTYLVSWNDTSGKKHTQKYILK